MKAVIAIDSLKGSLSSLEAGDAIRTGILRADRTASVQVRLLADGGEGTMEALTIGMGGEVQTVSVTGPLGAKVSAQYGILSDGATAIVERNADVVVTGEGRLDSQTVMGKAPIGVAELAKKYSKPVLAFAGCVTPDAVACNEHGIDAFFPILRGVVTLQEAMDAENARKNMADTVEQAFRLLAVKLG